MSAVYRGYGGHHGRVTVERDHVTLPLAHFVRHSPDGFAWGYRGSAPADLARCILIDHLGLRAQAMLNPDIQHPAPSVYQDFKADFVARWRWPGAAHATDIAWTLTGDEIFAWLLKRGVAQASARLKGSSG